MDFEEWEAHNARRHELIRKDTQGTLTHEERMELNSLQSMADEHIREHAPLPLAELQTLLDSLRSTEAERDAAYFAEHKLHWLGVEGMFTMHCPHCPDGTLFINVMDPDALESNYGIEARQCANDCPGITDSDVTRIMDHCKRIKDRYIGEEEP